jgi:VanZ family protein
LRAGHEGESNGGFLIATAIIIAVIIYGSLYPFILRHRAGGISPIQALLSSWAEPSSRGDFLANVLLYTPLGLFGFLAIAGRARVWSGILLAIVVGAVLSTSMELAQYYIPGRVTSASDVCANVIGTALGAIVGSVTRHNFRWPLLREIASNRVPGLLLALWLGYRLFPFVPTIDAHKYWNALKPVFLYSSLTRYELFRYTAIWLTIGALVEALGGAERSSLLFPLFIGPVLAAKVLIIGKALSAAEVAGAAIALVAWFFLAVSVGARFRLTTITVLFSAYVVVERLAPFQFTADGRHFGWIPFLSLLHGSLQVNIMSFFEKAFLYGSLIWLLRRAGLRLRIATVVVAAMLFVTSWAETYLTGRSAEITDAIIALLIGIIIGLIETPSRSNRAAVAGMS